MQPKPTTHPTDNGASPYRTPRSAPRVAPKRRPRTRPTENIVERAAAIGRFKTLGEAMTAAGLASTLTEKGPFTLFAPTDKAFGKMSSEDLRALLEDKTRLRELIGYHVVPSKVKAPSGRLPSALRTLDGRELAISVGPSGGGYQVDAARIVKTNIRASNGVIHAIDTVLTPR